MKGYDIMSNKIKEEIELLRHHLEKMIEKKGYTAKETIQISQQLDVLLNEWESTK